MSMLCQQRCCKPSIAYNQVLGVLWWLCGSKSYYIFRQWIFRQ